MNLQELRIIKSDQRGIMYDCDKLKFVSRKKGSISANHEHPDEEILYLLRGNIALTVGKKIQQVSAPTKIKIAGNTYHQLIALSDIEFLEDREGG